MEEMRESEKGQTRRGKRRERTFEKGQVKERMRF